jgi:hypothetical protein
MMRPALLSLLLLLPACSKSEPLAIPFHETAPIVQPLYATLYSNIQEPRRLLIRDAETWSIVWAEMVNSGDPRVPPYVDFSKEDVLVAAMGERRAAGYSIAITEVVQTANGARAVITSTVPGAMCESAEIMTAPLDAIRISKVNGAVTFDEQSVTRGCS